MIYWLMIASVWVIASFVIDAIAQATGLSDRWTRQFHKNGTKFWPLVYGYGMPTAVAFLFSQAW